MVINGLMWCVLLASFWLVVAVDACVAEFAAWSGFF
jgi:hypothetical protein